MGAWEWPVFCPPFSFQYELGKEECGKSSTQLIFFSISVNRNLRSLLSASLSTKIILLALLERIYTTFWIFFVLQWMWNGLSMMSAKEDSESLRIETLRERIFFAARDGLAITLYALLSELSSPQQSELLSQVKRH